MFAYLYGVITASAVNQKFAVGVYGNMVYLHPAFAFARSATPGVRAITFAAGSVLAGKNAELPARESDRGYGRPDGKNGGYVQ